MSNNTAAAMSQDDTLIHYLEEKDLTLKSTAVEDFGRLFSWKKRLFRGINDSHIPAVKEMFACGLIPDLIESKLFPDSRITDYRTDKFNLVIEHDQIGVLSYPYEWSFSMLKDAALTLLKVNLVAQRYGYQVTDGHPCNIVFDGLQPKFVDLGSFVKADQKVTGLWAHEEFLRSFYYPLQIFGKGYPFIARSILADTADSLPHQEYFPFCNNIFFRNCNSSLAAKLSKILFKYKKISLVSAEHIKNKYPGFFGQLIAFLQEKRILPFQTTSLKSLTAKVAKITPPNYHSRWGDYQNEVNHNSTNGKTPRFERICEIVKSLRVKSGVELGGNQGFLSRLLLTRHCLDTITCTDNDERAIDTLYVSSRGTDLSLSPVLLNCVFPKASFHLKPPYERFKADVVLALALTHHLTLTDNLSLNFVLEMISKYTGKYALVEFMSSGLWDGKNAPPLPDYYNIHWFRESFSRYFRLISEESMGNNRLLFLGELLEK